MNWHSYLRSRTRQPEFLWRMVIWMLAVGIGVGYLAEKIYQPDTADAQAADFEKAMESASLWDSLESLASADKWWQLWWTIPEVVYHCSSVGPVFLAVLSGCCWFAFLWQAMHAPSWRSLRFWAAVLAIPLGVLSIWPTVFFNYWMEHVWGLRESNELIAGVRYFVLSVGLREELCKLIYLLPLMPVLLSVRDELTALVVSGCVGLGFAVEENAGYFQSSGGTDSLGRFLMANPLHITLTALAGLMLYRTLRNPAWASHALGVLGMVILAHGLYDAFIVVTALGEISLMTTIIFALVVYQFFGELRDLRKGRGEMISLSSTFLFGVCLLLATTFVYLSATRGTSDAFDMLGQSVVGLAVMVYLFLREMPESMVTV